MVLLRLVVLCLCVAAGMTCPRRGLTAAEDGPAGGGGCKAQVSQTSIELPSSAVYKFSLHGEGNRNYTCLPNGKPGQSLALTRLSSGEYVGLSAQPTPTSAVVMLQHVGNGTPAGEIILDTTIPGSVFVESGPDAGTRVQPGRYIIRSTGDLPEANYVVRRNTSGGGPPENCIAPPGEFVPVPFTATFDYYLCV